ncbi:hypothetical protein [Phenylobacterium sp.]|uniref:hypothetical protein n=1 Tax=Phenylobacterium sp. TaxID=1871053 RepID=UPI0035B26930
MKVMTRLNVPLVAALMAGAALAAGPASAEINPGQQEGLGLTARNVPDLLKKAQTDPYTATTCEAAYQEVAQLDQILGPDADEPEAEKSQAGNLLMKGARSLIPYREVFRMVTGVDRKERELAEAAMAGWARRGYLKGYLRDQCSGNHTIASAEPAAQPAAAVAPAPEPAVAPTVQQVSGADVADVGAGPADTALVAEGSPAAESTATLAAAQAEVNP